MRIFTTQITLVTAVWGAVTVWIAFTNEPLFTDLARKDGPDGGGLFENLTVLVLLPGIAAGAYTVVRRWRSLPSRLIGAWVAVWTLASFYFAGEETSWLQWQLGYATPEMFGRLNDQGEANLHNMSSWLDQKPRAAVESFVVLAGLIAPLALHLRSGLLRPALREWADWLLAPACCWAPALFFLVLRLSSWMPSDELRQLGTSEHQELAIAWFLAVYLVSYLLRTGTRRRRPADPPPQPNGAHS